MNNALKIATPKKKEKKNKVRVEGGADKQNALHNCVKESFRGKTENHGTMRTLRQK